MAARILCLVAPAACDHWFVELRAGAICAKCGTRKALAAVVPFKAA